jgi:predicted dehydrogenase
MQACKVGVIGIGDISDVYIRHLQSHPGLVTVLGCAGRDLAKAQAKAAQHGIERAYADAQALLADPDIDLVLNLTVPAAHAELNLAALRAGKHVYTEKPLAATRAEGEQIMALAAERGLSVACAPDTFFGGRLQTARALIDAGRIGRVVGASACFVSQGHEHFHPNPDFFYKPGAGPVMDIGPYYITALLALMGPIARVGALASRSDTIRRVLSGPLQGQAIAVEVDTHVSAQLAFVSGAIGQMLLSFDVWESNQPRLEIHGTEGTLCLPDADPYDGPNVFGGPLWLRTGSEYRWGQFPRRQPTPEWIEVPIRHGHNSVSHQENSRGIGVIDQVLALREGRPARASGALALHALDVMESLLDASRDGGRFLDLRTRCERPAALPELFPC